jgi:transcriptional regulator with XRE-family HTH domain
MDQRNEIRELLASRRARITPQQAGLPADGGHRRMPGLRREEVALLAGVSVDYYTQIERGNLGGVSDSVLHAPAGALQLDEAERAYLFDLAQPATTPARPRRPRGPQRVRPSLQRLLDAMTGVPAYVRSGRLDILGSTGSARPCTRQSWPASRCRSTDPGSASREALAFLASWAATLDQPSQPATAPAPEEP